MGEELIIKEEPVIELPKKKEEKIRVDRITGLRISGGYSWVGFRKDKKIKKVPYKQGQTLVDHKFFTEKEFDELENYI